MGELGFKYDPASDLGKENAKRILADKYASDDSNMFIYDCILRRIDMADAVIQNMRAGYAGVILWDLDDAMYNLLRQEEPTSSRDGVSGTFWVPKNLKIPPTKISVHGFIPCR